VAWNAAAAEARGEVLCFVNDDVVLGAGSLRRLWNVLTERPEAGVAGPVGTRWDIERFRHLKWLDVSQLEPGEVLECEVVSGFCFGTRREVFRQTGGFDEAYTPCGAEEVDYCTTVRLRLGLKCYAVAGVAHQHEFGISTARRWRRLSYDGRSETVGRIAARNREYFLSKWTGEDPPGLAWAPGQASAVGRADRLA
jgi:GT2 family glycosyltransferase